MCYCSEKQSKGSECLCSLAGTPHIQAKGQCPVCGRIQRPSDKRIDGLIDVVTEQSEEIEGLRRELEGKKVELATCEDEYEALAEKKGVKTNYLQKIINKFSKFRKK
jgi:hypothetical protein